LTYQVKKACFVAISIIVGILDLAPGLMKTRSLFILAGVLIVANLARVGLMDYNEILAWEHRRMAWHEQCDQYRGQSTAIPAVKVCHQELDALLSRAADPRRRGTDEG
jgi:hypothetical protein